MDGRQQHNSKHLLTTAQGIVTNIDDTMTQNIVRFTSISNTATLRSNKDRLSKSTRLKLKPLTDEQHFNAPQNLKSLPFQFTF